ncbi:MAG: class I SAM-dependent RNA methyltransferase [Anaerolineae bacterium]|nr:class I SAM-dependent RNA methyltransferase [Anaerolineae bacterium]
MERNAEIMDRHIVNIEKLVYGGDGMGRLADGKAVFVPFVLPGETVEVKVTDSRQRFARGAVITILDASPDRVSPRCKHFEQCGGCHYQMMPYPAQVAAKESIVKDQFARIAGLEIDDILSVISAESPWQYRQTLELHIEGGKPGFLAANSHAMVAVEECHLCPGTFDDIRNMLDFDEESGIHTARVRWGDVDLMVVIDGDAEMMPEIEVDFPVSIVFTGGDEESGIVLAGDDYQTITVLDTPLVVSGTSFFQASAAMAGEMVTSLLDHLHPGSGDVLLDLYCGIGLFSRFFGERGAVCIGVEASSSAVSNFAANLDHLDDVSIYEGLVEDVLPGLDIHPTICIIDPPRAGVKPSVLDQIIRLRVPRLAYVACDPATQARDVKRLVSNGYRLEKVILLDQFPQTYHIETICFLHSVD